MAAKRKRRRKAAAAPRKRRRRSTRRNPGILANPRRRRRATTTRRRSRRRVRRNPTLGGTMKFVTRGVQDAAVMVGGEMASNIIAAYIPAFLKDETGAESATGASLRKVIAAAVVGYGAQMLFRGGDIARFAVAGALASPLKAFVRPMLPATGIISQAALSSYPMNGYLSAYPMPLLPRLGAYPQRNGLGCDDNGDGMSGQAVAMDAYGQR